MPEAIDQAIAEAEAAAEDASRWHQGSGTHADGCVAVICGLAEGAEGTLATDGVMALAGLWVDAAKAEAAHLNEVEGAWVEPGTWEKSQSGVAFYKALQETRKVIPKFEFFGPYC